MWSHLKSDRRDLRVNERPLGTDSHQQTCEVHKDIWKTFDFVLLTCMARNRWWEYQETAQPNLRPPIRLVALWILFAGPKPDLQE